MSPPSSDSRKHLVLPRTLLREAYEIIYCNVVEAKTSAPQYDPIVAQIVF